MESVEDRGSTREDDHIGFGLGQVVSNLNCGFFCDLDVHPLVAALAHCYRVGGVVVDRLFNVPATDWCVSSGHTEIEISD